MRKMKNIYALYKGDNCLAVGTARDIAKQLNIDIKTVMFYQTPAWEKRHKNLDMCKLLIKIDGKEETDE